MGILAAILLLIFTFGVHAAFFPSTKNSQLRIDCGVKSNVFETINHDNWFPDSFFINSGEIKQLTSPSTDAPQFLNTLRHFPQGENTSYCYPLLLVNTQKYIFRAGFYYANYDGRSSPPAFDLLLGGQEWTTVDTSNDPMFEEVVYWPRNDNITVCLAGRKGGGKPFISSLEATALDATSTINQTVMYERMNKGTAYRLVSRFNFGGYNKVVEPWSMWTNPCEENQNRYWTPQQMIGYAELTFDHSTACTGEMYENIPPDSVITTAITPPHTSALDSIYVPIHFPSSSAQTAYIVLYFYQHVSSSESPSATRIMDIYLDGVPMETVRFEEYRSGQVVTLYPVKVRSVANLTIAPGEKTALSPLLNGMEVFTETQMEQEVFSYGFRVSCSYIVAGIFQVLVSGLLVLD